MSLTKSLLYSLAILGSECASEFVMKFFVDNSEISSAIDVSELSPNSIANILNIDKEYVSVKATTWEKMGFVGRGEAIACEAVCLVNND